MKSKDSVKACACVTFVGRRCRRQLCFQIGHGLMKVSQRQKLETTETQTSTLLQLLFTAVVMAHRVTAVRSTSVVFILVVTNH